MVDKVINHGKLETIIANHLNNAQIAVNANNNPFRSITAVIGLTEEYYEFTVFDSGIPFEVDTLERLGTERVTTHSDTGGSGIGFMTTFQTMQEYNASLIIDEQKPSAVDYSKSVSVRFDNKNQYIIKTYRPDDFASCDRYTVVSH
jgi:signal transduction histidine kinase